MPKNLRFWTNVGLIAFAHILVIVGLIRWSRESKNASAQSVVWLNGGGGDGLVTEKKNLPAPVKSPLPRKESRTELLKERESAEDRPYLASAPSEIQLPTPKPSPPPTATPVHTPKSKPKETPKPTPKPKATPKPTPKPSPKKMVLVKASPKPSPIAKPTPEKTENEQVDVETEKKEIAKPVVAKIEEKEPKKSPAAQTGSDKGIAPGVGGGRVGGAGPESQFGWYGSMLHDRFYSEWVQPTTPAAAESKNSVLVKLRIEKDGRVSSFEIVRPSGNSDLDESVKALANRVGRVEPVPDGLGKGDHYDVKINFELNSE
jgi:TonB family protein